MALGCDAPGHAAAQAEHVTVHSTNPSGVPLHPAEHSQEMTGRLPNGATVEVLGWGQERRWLEVRAADGVRGWIVRRYVERGPPGAAVPAAPDAFRSLADCASLYAQRGPASPRGPRIASWNVRWFPDGSSHGPSEQVTDVEHLACVLALLDVDAVALQEILLHERGERALAGLVSRLDERTGGRWRAHADQCPRDARQHLVWLVNEVRVRADPPTQLDALNPLGGCAHRLRPGLALYLRFDGGPDLHVINAHLDSGVEARDYGHRQRSIAALEGAIATLRPADDDVLIIGDLNTMGRRVPAVSPHEELRALDASLVGQTPALRRVTSGVSCTEYYRRHGSLLDHALASVAMAELPVPRLVEVAGPCASHRCALPRGVHPPSLERLSDHCPIVVQLDPADLD